jgi:hypothetical protein
MRQEMGIVEECRARHRIVPDLTMIREQTKRPEGTAASGVATPKQPRRDVSKSVEYTLIAEPGRHHFVEIRDSKQGYKLVTLIEILSHSNKRPGPDRDAYRAKQSDGAGH